MQPQNYALIIPQRCRELLESYYSDEKSKPNGNEVTLLLALATPAILFPLQKLSQPDDASVGEFPGTVSPQTEEKFKKFLAMGKGLQSLTPVYRSVSTARMIRCKAGWCCEKSPIKGELPQEIREQLSDEGSLDNFRKTENQSIVSVFRNALAHGGVIYADDNHAQKDFGQIDRIVFVSRWKKNNVVCGLNFLSLSPDDFRLFVVDWCEMLGRQFPEILRAPFQIAA